MCAFIQGGFKGPWMAAEGGIHHGWLQKEGYTAPFKWSTNGVQMDIPSVSYSLHLYIPNIPDQKPGVHFIKVKHYFLAFKTLLFGI